MECKKRIPVSNYAFTSNYFINLFNKQKKLNNLDEVKKIHSYSFKEHNFKIDQNCCLLKYKCTNTFDLFKSFLIYETCTDLQKEKLQKLFGYLDVFDDPDNDSEVILIDAEAGTGKSFLVSAFIGLLDSAIDVQVIVYQHNLVNELAQSCLPNKKFNTVASYLIKLFGMQFKQYSTLLGAKSKDCTRHEQKQIILFKLCLIAAHLDFRTTVLIVDEYTVIETLYLFVLLVAAFVFEKIFIIFVGGHNQQLPIKSTHLHKFTNYLFLQSFQTQEQISLVKQMRQDDVSNDILSFLNEFSDNFSSSKKLLSFDSLYKIFRKFEANFSKPVLFNEKVVYLSSKHKFLTRKMKRIFDYVKENNIPYLKLPYHVVINKKYTYYTADDDDFSKKFPQCLYLFEGYQYTYTIVANKKVMKRSVTLVKIDETNKMLHLADESGNVIFMDYTRQIEYTSYYMNEIFRDYLYEEFKKALGDVEIEKMTIYQIPLAVEFVRTFHAIQGQTIPHPFTIELELSEIEERQFYVGRTRGKSEESYGRFHTTEILNLYVNKEYESIHDGKFYYRISNKEQTKFTKNPNNYVFPDENTFIEVDNYRLFMTNTNNCKIARHALVTGYKCDNNERESTESSDLMDFLRKIKNNKDEFKSIFEDTTQLVATIRHGKEENLKTTEEFKKFKAFMKKRR